MAVAGEAARLLSDQTRALFPSVPWHSIAGLRNVVIHEYFRIDTTIVVDIIDTEATPLADAIREHLAKDSGNPGTTPAG